MYLIYNNDGSIKLTNANEFITQHSNNVNPIYVAIEGRDYADYSCNAIFTLPNETSHSKTATRANFTYSGEEYNGYVIWLSNAETLYAGTLNVNLRFVATSNDSILWTYSFGQTINASTDDWDSEITEAEYNNLLQVVGRNIDSFDPHLIRAYTTLALAQNDISRLSVNEFIFVGSSELNYKIYQKNSTNQLVEVNSHEFLYQLKNDGLDVSMVNGVVTITLTRNDNSVDLTDTFNLNDFTYAKANLYTKSESDARFLNADYSYSKAETNALLDDKVDKASGYGLMSDSEKTKLNGIENGAEVNVIETIKVNGTALIPDEKAVDVSVPTAYASTPNMDGVGSSGSSTNYAKGDHTHPTDTSRLAINPNGTDNLLDGNNKINTIYIPDTLLGQVSYKGNWNANSNTSQIVGTLSDGNYYICTTNGRYNPDGTDTGTANYYGIGDWAIYHTGTGWGKVANTDAVTMVNSQIGSVETYKGLWQTNTLYYKGDTIQYNNELYLCVTSHTSSSTFDATKFKKYYTRELFYCTYGTTTYAEITQALSDGKLPVCFYDNKQYVYVGLSTTNRYTFASQLFDTNRYVSVNDSNSWGGGSTNFEITTNKVTSISSGSTDSQYPSAKAVYNYAQPIINSSNKLSTDLISGLSTVATTGSYNDLINTPTIPTAKSVDNTTIEDNSNVLSVKALPLTTTAPNSDNSSGVLNFVKLSSKPANMYSGYVYMVETIVPAGYTLTFRNYYSGLDSDFAIVIYYLDGTNSGSLYKWDFATYFENHTTLNNVIALRIYNEDGEASLTVDGNSIGGGAMYDYTYTLTSNIIFDVLEYCECYITTTT